VTTPTTSWSTQPATSFAGGGRGGLDDGGDDESATQGRGPAHGDIDDRVVDRAILDGSDDRGVGGARRPCLGADQHHGLGGAIENRRGDGAEHHGAAVAPVCRQACQTDAIVVAGGDDDVGHGVALDDPPARDRVASRQRVDVPQRVVAAGGGSRT
jgi:hypothetical protein